MRESRFIGRTFSTEQVEALLAETKTQDRRMDGLQAVNENPDNWELSNFKPGFRSKALIAAFADTRPKTNNCITKISPYQIGDVIWVKETFCPIYSWTDGLPDDSPTFAYRADEHIGYDIVGWKWRPNIHMPKSACRLFLEITDVRVERLNEISENDSWAEGMDWNGEQVNTFSNLTDKKGLDFETAKEAYIDQWESIHGFDTFNNRYVFKLTFEKISQPKTFLDESKKDRYR